ncbi:MAG: hypothetical protein JST16_06650 [Bdellovibrionales bacterium]|nr:hypothetical protein [Bdellovibrionales bacterium]
MKNGNKLYANALALVLGGLLASGCTSQPTTVAATNTDRFTNHMQETYAQASAVLRGDYLFVVDYSYSMSTKISHLLDAMKGFSDDLVAKGIDYQVGIVRGNFHGTASGAQVNEWTPNTFVEGIFSGETNNALVSNILDTLKVAGNELEPNRVVLLESARKTLSEQKSKFLRNEAQLILTFVSDSNDESASHASQYGFAGTPDAYADALASYKVPGYTNARAVVAGVDGCSIDAANNDAAGTTLASVAKKIEAKIPAPVTNALCIYNSFDLTLSTLAANVVHPTSSFVLQSAPLNNAVVVRVNGTDVPSAGNWTFDPATNLVKFASGKEPGPSAKVELIYQIAFKLSQTPKPDTIQVTVNGANVTNWTYVASENRIQFSTLPPNDADVRITYESQ